MLPLRVMPWKLQTLTAWCPSSDGDLPRLHLLYSYDIINYVKYMITLPALCAQYTWGTNLLFGQPAPAGTW